MVSLRALRHPLTPLVGVLVALPLATLAAPGHLRAGLLLLVCAVGSPVAALLAVRALRRALAQVPVVEGSAPSDREATLERWLRVLLVAVPVVGSFVNVLALGALGPWRPPAAPETSAPASVFLAAVPLLFTLLGVRLWRDLVAARRQRAAGLAPPAPEPPSTTGDPGLDRLLPAKGRTAFRLGVLTLVVSSLANALPPLQRDPDKLAWAVQSLAKVTSAIENGEPYRFFTATFVHGDLAGLVVGVLAFAAVAPLVEKLLGGKWLVVAYVGGGFAATVASWAFMPDTRISMGMTGAVAAITGVLLFFGVLQRTRLPPAALRRIAVRASVVLAILAFASALLPYADVAAHLGGFTFGAALSLVARPQQAVREAMAQARAEALRSAPAQP